MMHNKNVMINFEDIWDYLDRFTTLNLNKRKGPKEADKNDL